MISVPKSELPVPEASKSQRASFLHTSGHLSLYSDLESRNASRPVELRCVTSARVTAKETMNPRLTRSDRGIKFNPVLKIDTLTKRGFFEEKTCFSNTKTQKRNTQNSKTKLQLTRKRNTQNAKTKHLKLEKGANLTLTSATFSTCLTSIKIRE